MKKKTDFGSIKAFFFFRVSMYVYIVKIKPNQLLSKGHLFLYYQSSIK